MGTDEEVLELLRRGEREKALEVALRAYGPGVLGYLENVRDLRSTECHPLLLADVRPDSGLYYPCIELKYARQKVLEHGSLEEAQRAAERDWGPVPKDCGEGCQIFCHMALSMSQASLRAGLGELKTI